MERDNTTYIQGELNNNFSQTLKPYCFSGSLFQPKLKIQASELFQDDTFNYKRYFYSQKSQTSKGLHLILNIKRFTSTDAMLTKQQRNMGYLT